MGLLCVFSFIALGSGQRSVWLAIGLGSLLLLWLYRRRSVFLLKFVTVTMMILFVGTVAVTAFPVAAVRLVEKFGGIIDPYSDRTASWRIRGWQEHLTTIRKVGPLLGEGLGSYYSWTHGSVEVTASPHNAYIQLVLKFGLVGLMIYALLAYAFFRKMSAIRKKLPPGPMRAYVEMGIVNFGAGHGYMLGYGFEPIMLIFFGLAVSAAKLCQGGYLTTRPLLARTVRPDHRSSSQRFRPQRVSEAAPR
jgi:O-antigen ligase